MRKAPFRTEFDVIPTADVNFLNYLAEAFCFRRVLSASVVQQRFQECLKILIFNVYYYVVSRDKVSNMLHRYVCLISIEVHIANRSQGITESRCCRMSRESSSLNRERYVIAHKMTSFYIFRIWEVTPKYLFLFSSPFIWLRVRESDK